jgi:peptide/nickel transport system substrate-binding protein
MKSDQKTPLRPHNSIRESAPRLSVADDAKLTDALRCGATRREVMGWLLASGMTATVAGTLIARVSDALAQTPKKGGQLRVAGFSSSTKDTLDPARGSVSTDYVRGFMFYNALARLDESLTAQPELAESWDANANATEWVFRLRKEVTFHDGKKLDSEDVVYSILRHKDPKVASTAKTLVDQVQEVKADGPNLVRMGRGRTPSRNSSRAFGPSPCAIRIIGSRTGLMSRRSSFSASRTMLPAPRRHSLLFLIAVINNASFFLDFW